MIVKSSKRYIVVGLFFIVSFCSIGQKYKNTVLYAKPMKDSILLRWQVYDTKLWSVQLKAGFDVYRKSQTGEITKVNDTIIHALNPKEFALNYLKVPVIKDTAQFIRENSNYTYSGPDMNSVYKPDTLAQKAMALLFADELGATFPMPGKDELLYFGDDPREMMHLFHSIICLSHKEAAVTAGLFFADKTIKRGEIYTYYLTAAGKGMSGVLAQTRVGSMDPYVLNVPIVKKDFYSKKKVILAWNKIDTLNEFIPTYEVYRSLQKNTGYKKINKDPVLAVYDGESIADTTIVSSTDTTIQKNVSYYYKVRGLDIFGEYSPYSEPFLVTPRVPLEYMPILTKVEKVGSPYQGLINWQIQSVDEENIASISLFKSTNADTLFKVIAPKLKTTDRTYTDKTLTHNNYYKLLMIGKAGDSLWSSPAYLMVPDSIPPAAPVIKSAICDSLGKVTITWSHSNEVDLYGFYVYRGNFKKDEFSRIRTILKVDTAYVDTISLGIFNDAVYYELIAIDDSYNRSPSSNIMKAKRYDTIIPTSAVFRTFKSNKEGILLEWGNSSSSDVVKTTLYRKLKDELSWHAYKVFARDTARYTSFRDTALVRGKWYEYKLQTTDDDKLVSAFSNTLTIMAYDDGIRAELTDIKVKANTRKGIVKISWKYGNPGVKNFQVFRGQNDKKPIILQSIKPNVFEFYDRSLAPGATYTYIIKAEYLDGGESPFCKPIVVKMK